MNSEEKEFLVNECNQRWNYIKEYFRFYLLESDKYQKENGKNLLLYEKYCINNNLDATSTSSKLMYSKEVLNISTSNLPIYCCYESLCNSKGLPIFDKKNKNNKVKKLFGRKK